MRKSCENCAAKISCASYIALKSIKEEIPNKYPWLDKELPAVIEPEHLAYCCKVYLPMIKEEVSTPSSLR